MILWHSDLIFIIMILCIHFPLIDSKNLSSKQVSGRHFTNWQCKQSAFRRFMKTSLIFYIQKRWHKEMKFRFFNCGIKLNYLWLSPGTDWSSWIHLFDCQFSGSSYKRCILNYKSFLIKLAANIVQSSFFYNFLACHCFNCK